MNPGTAFLLRAPAAFPLRMFVALTLFVCYSFSPAQTQDPCQSALERAEDQYDVGEYDEVIRLLKQCPPEQFPEVRHQIRAYKLLSLAQLEIGDRRQAEAAAEKLLDRRPQFDPDPKQEPQEFVTLVDQIKQQRAKGSSRKWLWIGGGGLVAGAVAAYFLLQNDELQDLPLPPDPPM